MKIRKCVLIFFILTIAMKVAPIIFLLFFSLQNVSAVSNTTSNSTTIIFNPDTPLEQLPAGKPIDYYLPRN
jgi:hypothetical protein